MWAKCASSLSVGDLLQLVDVSAPCATRAEVTGITHDSRQVIPGSLFVAVPGVNTDGARYIRDAVQRGAIAVITETPCGNPGVPVARVANARAALSYLSDLLHDRPSQRLRIAGITGTNGKTTVSFFLRQLLSACGCETGLLGTVAYEFGYRSIPAQRTTPEAPMLHSLLAQMHRGNCSDVVMEVSSHALSLLRVNDIAFDAAVFTNLTRDHLDFHGTMEEYYHAKAVLFRRPELQLRVIGTDDPYGQRLVRELDLPGRVLTFGLSPSADVRAERVMVTDAGTCGHMDTPWGSHRFQLATPGEHNVRNLLAAVAVAGGYGLPMSTVFDAIDRLTPAPGRLEPVPSRVGQIFVDYAHTPDALENVLRTLRPMTGGRLIALFGCGGERDRSKRPMMVQAAARHADLLVLTQDNPRKEDPQQIFADMRRGVPEGFDWREIPDRREAIRETLELIRPGDVVLIAGKGHEPYQELAYQVIPFDDRAVAAACLRELNKAPVDGD